MFINKGQFEKNEIIIVLLMGIFCTARYEKQRGLIYVLMWKNNDLEPFVWWSNVSKSLVLMNCAFKNCFFTYNDSYLLYEMDFDVILYNAPDITTDNLPSTRSDNQLYVFVSTESATNCPISKQFDNFFNYTWTYKLNSDIPYPYFVVRIKRTGEVVAPKEIVHWIKHKKMAPTSKSIIHELQTKSIAAAWFESDCHSINGQQSYVRRLKEQLMKLGHQLHIYGQCYGNKLCPKFSSDCVQLLKVLYYFYLSFENSVSHDYVTESILTAVDNYAIPVVRGGANYTRFLPNGAYLNAEHYTPIDLAIRMDRIIKNKDEYYDFFRFHRYYSYHPVSESEDTDPLCVFCNFVNKDIIWKQRRSYGQFNKWWTSQRKIH